MIHRERYAALFPAGEINSTFHRPHRAATVLIEKGDEHEILNDGRGLLKTLNFCVPPAYDREGDEPPRGKR